MKDGRKVKIVIGVETSLSEGSLRRRLKFALENMTFGKFHPKALSITDVPTTGMKAGRMDSNEQPL